MAGAAPELSIDAKEVEATVKQAVKEAVKEAVKDMVEQVSANGAH